MGSMADPLFRSSSNVSASTAATFAVTKPTGTVDGDLLTAYELTSLGGGSDPATPTGWSLKDTQTAGIGLVLQRFEKLAASEGASWTFNGAGGSPVGNESSVYVVCSSPGGTASEGSSKASGSSVTADPGSYTTLQANELLIVAWGVDTSVATTTPHASFTGLSTIGGTAKLTVGYKSQAVAGASANTSATISTSSSWGAILAAIPPPTAGATFPPQGLPPYPGVPAAILTM